MPTSPFGLAGSALLASVPLLWLLVSLGVLRLKAHFACPVALAAGALLAAAVWDLETASLARAALEGALIGVWPILWVVFAAIFTYNLSQATGAMQRVRRMLAGVSSDRRLQALLIGFGFGGFLEGAAGFGTAVAIPAAILIGLGFEPRRAAIVCLVANTIPVAFGALGVPVITLAQVTDLDLAKLTFWCALQLTPLVIVLPLTLVVLLTRSLAGLRGVVLGSLATGLAFAVPQLALARWAGPELTAVCGALSVMLVVGAWARFFPPAVPWRFPGEEGAPAAAPEEHAGVREQLVAWSPYLVMLLLILGTGPLVPPLHAVLAQVKTAVAVVPGAKPLTFEWLLSPGSLILVGALVGGLLQGARPRAFLTVLVHTARQLGRTALTVVSIAALARVMGSSGMSAAIAVALAHGTGSFYPLLAPLVGALGTFVTGSDTSSNVLFGPLQKQTALQIGADPHWLAAANASGATAGKMISPQSIAVAATATGQQGREGELLRGTLAHALVYALLLGLLVAMFAP